MSTCTKMLLLDESCEVFLNDRGRPFKVFVEHTDVPNVGRMYDWHDLPLELQDAIEGELIARSV